MHYNVCIARVGNECRDKCVGNRLSMVTVDEKRLFRKITQFFPADDLMVKSKLQITVPKRYRNQPVPKKVQKFPAETVAVVDVGRVDLFRSNYGGGKLVPELVLIVYGFYGSCFLHAVFFAPFFSFTVLPGE